MIVNKLHKWKRESYEYLNSEEREHDTEEDVLHNRIYVLVRHLEELYKGLKATTRNLTTSIDEMEDMF